MKELIAFCGLDHDTGGARSATLKGDTALREKTAGAIHANDPAAKERRKGRD